MFRAITPLLPFTFLLAIFAPGLLPTPACAEGEIPPPPRIAILFLPEESFPWPHAVPLLLERGLDSRGIRFEPVALNPGAAENLAALLAHSTGAPLNEQRIQFLRAEARSRKFDTLLLLREVKGEQEGFTLTATTGDFGELVEFRNERWIGNASPEGMMVLLDNMIAALGWPSCGEAPFIYEEPTREERYARALVAGSPLLFQEIMEDDSTHQGGMLHFASRLLLGESPHRGRGLLDSIDERALPLLERSMVPAWRAVASGDRAALLESVESLESRFPGRFETQLLRGILAGLLRNWNEGEEALRRASEMRPFDPLPHRLIGNAALEQGFLDLAEHQFRAADNLGMGDPLAQIGLASVRYSEGRVDEAENILNEMPPLFPHNWTAWFLYSAARSNLFMARGLFHEAERTLQEARDEAHRTGNEEALIDLTIRLCHVYLEGNSADAAAGETGELRFRRISPAMEVRQPGILPYLEGLVGVARESFGTVSAKKLEIETTAGANEAWLAHLEGRYLLEIGAGWEAVPYLRSAAQLDSSLVNNLHLGHAYLAADQAERARHILEEMVERGESLLESPPSIPLAFYYLGRSLEKLGDHNLAHQAFREFLIYWQRPNQVRAEWRYANEAIN